MRTGLTIAAVVVLVIICFLFLFLGSQGVEHVPEAPILPANTDIVEKVQEADESCQKSTEEEILLDPEDKSQKLSYWRDAKVGDWVRFLNHRKNVIIFKIIERQDDIVKFTSIEYKRTGDKIPEEDLDIRIINIKKDDEIMRGCHLGSPYGIRTVFKWKLYKSNKLLNCERYFVENPRGESSETLWCREICCGGYVFQRRGEHTVITLIDYGDANKPPKWDNIKPDELLKYWQDNDSFTDETPKPEKKPLEK